MMIAGEEPTVEEFGIIFYDENNEVNISVPFHSCLRCTCAKDRVATLPHVYSVKACGLYYSEILAQLQAYNARLLAVIEYQIIEQKRAYVVLKVKGNIRYLAGQVE